MKRFLNICYLSVFVIVSAFSQAEICEGGQTGAYIHLTDASGFNDRCRYETDLEAAVQDILLLTPSDQQNNFKVFDYGFYLLNNTYLDGVNRARSIAIEEATSNSTYYIIFSKQSDVSGIYSRIYVDFNLDLFPCIGNQEDLLAEVNAHASWEYDGQAINYARIEIEILQLIFNKIACCNIEGAKGKTFKSLEMDSECIETSDRLKYLELLSSMQCDFLNNSPNGTLVNACRTKLDNYLPPTNNIFPTQGATVLDIDDKSYYFYIYNVPGVNELYTNDGLPLPTNITFAKPDTPPNGNNPPRPGAKFQGWLYDYGMVKIVSNYRELPNYLAITKAEIDAFLAGIKTKILLNQNLEESDKDGLLSRINCGTNFLDDDLRYYIISQFVLGNNNQAWKEAARLFQEVKSFFSGEADLLNADEEVLVLQLLDDFESSKFFFEELNKNPLVGYQMFSGVEILNKDFIFFRFKELYDQTTWNEFDNINITEIPNFVYLNDDYNKTIFIDKFDFTRTGNEIIVNRTEALTGFELGGMILSFEIGRLHFLAPIQVGPVETLFDIPVPDPESNPGADTQANATYLPAILVYEIDRINANKTTLTTSLITAEVILTFSGIGNLTKLRALGQLPFVTRLAARTYIVGEFIIPPTNIALRYSKNCTNSDFCKELRKHLQYVEIAFAAKQVTALMRSNIRNSAKAAQSKKPNSPTDPDEIGAIKYVDEVADGIDAILNSLKGKIPVGSPLRAYVDKLSKTAQAAEIRSLNKLDEDALVELNKVNEFLFKRFSEVITKSGKNDELIAIFNSDPSTVRAWEILFKEGEDVLTGLGSNPDNLEKLANFIKVESADIKKLKSSFQKANYPDTWLNLKLTRSELDNLSVSIINDPPANIDPWTPDHKAQRWNNHKEAKGDNDFNSWSNRYDGNIGKAKRGDVKVREYAVQSNIPVPPAEIERPWPGDLTINIRGQNLTGKRRHDLYDELNNKVYEVKEYKNQNVSKSFDIEREALMDIKIKIDNPDLEIIWVFLDRGPSGPLRKLLKEGGITIYP